MIVVLDTNAIVSASLSPRGNPAEIIRRWETDEFDIATSPDLIQELKKALGYDQVRKYTKVSDEDLQSLLSRFQTITIIVDPQTTLYVVDKDPDDNRVLECALAARAHYVVTGNKHLLDLKEYQGIIILTPATFLSLLELEKGKPA